ncbi:MAG: hypothetical protein AAGF95_34660 [Chloroflexota bacterium]
MKPVFGMNLAQEMVNVEVKGAYNTEKQLWIGDDGNLACTVSGTCRGTSSCSVTSSCVNGKGTLDGNPTDGFVD